MAKRNAGSFTYDGISTGGERVAHEVVEEIERLEREGQKITRLSVVGYSLGGLVARYAIGLLESKGFFEKIKPVVSTTHWFACTQRSATSGFTAASYCMNGD